MNFLKVKRALCLISIANPIGPYCQIPLAGRTYNFTDQNRQLVFNIDPSLSQPAGLNALHKASLPDTKCPVDDLARVLEYRKRQAYSITQVSMMLFNQIFFLLIIDSGLSAFIFGIFGYISKLIFWLLIYYPIIWLIIIIGSSMACWGIMQTVAGPIQAGSLSSNSEVLQKKFMKSDFVKRLKNINHIASHPRSREEMTWLAYRVCAFLVFMYLKFWYSNWSQVLSYIAMLYMIVWHVQATIYSNEMNIFAPFKRQPITSPNVCTHLFKYELLALDLFLMLCTLFFVVNNSSLILAFAIRIVLAVIYIITALFFLREYSYIANEGSSYSRNDSHPAFHFTMENIGAFDFWWPLIAYFFFKLELKDRSGMILPI